jgi:hypothetical protein
VLAALLPHKTLRIQDDKTPTVAADEVSTSGTANRDKILKAAAKIIAADGGLPTNFPKTGALSSILPKPRIPGISIT